MNLKSTENLLNRMINDWVYDTYVVIYVYRLSHIAHFIYQHFVIIELRFLVSDNMVRLVDLLIIRMYLLFKIISSIKYKLRYMDSIIFDQFFFCCCFAVSLRINSYPFRINQMLKYFHSSVILSKYIRIYIELYATQFFLLHCW